LVATDLFKKLYKGENGVFARVTDPNVAEFVKNFSSDGSALNYRNQSVASLEARTIPVATDNDAVKPVSDGYTYADLTAKKSLEAHNLNTLLARVVSAEANITPTEAQIASYATAVTTAQTALSSALTAYNADRTNATLRANYESALRAFDSAQETLTTQTALRARNSEGAQKLRAAYDVLAAAANFIAANDAIGVYNNALAGLADKYAAWQKVLDKATLLYAQASALRTVALSTSKEDAVKALKDELTSLKNSLNELKKAQETLKETNVTNNTRDIEKAAAVIEAQEAIVAAKTAELNYVKAQLAALGVQ
jgi:hypothetical protein